MPDAPPNPPGRRPVDARALQRIAQRMSRQPQPPWLHGEVAQRMSERLPLIKQQPRRIANWSPWLGASDEALKAACGEASIVPVEPLPPLRARLSAGAQRPWWSLRRAAPLVLAPEEVPPGSVDLVWANMLLHGAEDPTQVFDQWHRALAVDGFLMFSTLGPGTLESLRGLYADRGWGTPMAPLVDMHDLGDMLVHAGFADPVMDQEVVTLTWATPQAALDELRSLGGNADAMRHAGLRSRRWREELLRGLATLTSPDGRVALTFEVVYGHAFRVAARPRVQSQTEVSLEAMREMVRSGRARGT